jgi:hypothetical protein
MLLLLPLLRSRPSDKQLAGVETLHAAVHLL